jgi:hypothetical protein
MITPNPPPPINSRALTAKIGLKHLWSICVIMVVPRFLRLPDELERDNDILWFSTSADGIAEHGRNAAADGDAGAVDALKLPEFASLAD